MATTETKPDDPGATADAPQSGGGTRNNDLCGLCVRALTINDDLAGRAKSGNRSGVATALELYGFPYNCWRAIANGGPRTVRTFDAATKGRPGACGWTTYARDASRKVKEETRRFCFGDQHKRRVTVPDMPEISKPTVGACRLCARLRALFAEQYKECSWWDDAGTTFFFTIQYEWSEWRTIRKGEDQTKVLPHGHRMEGLAVLVFRLGLKPDTVDVLEFDVVAWPGPCMEWLMITSRPLDPDGTMSERNAVLMRQCIEKCNRDHEECKKKTTKNTFVPKRLLDLGNNESSSVRLLEHVEMHPLGNPESQVQYATLSYCWGNSVPMITTKANKHEHEN